MSFLPVVIRQPNGIAVSQNGGSPSHHRLTRLKLSDEWDDLGYPHDLGNLHMFVCEIPPVETANTTPLRLRHALRPGVARY